MSSKTQVAALAATLAINRPTEIDRAILAAMTDILAMFTPSPTGEEEKQTRLLALHGKMAAKASHILELKSELEGIKPVAEKWYRTIKEHRTRRMGGMNPWREEARVEIAEKTGESNSARIDVMVVDYLIHLKYKWKTTWEKMGELEKSLHVRSNHKTKQFRELLGDCDAVSMKMFEADMQKYRDLAYSLSVEYLKVIEVQRAMC
ncbi:hypothetical protein V8F20_003335 [Naviculisporaceae sp. PSN 640]